MRRCILAPEAGLDLAKIWRYLKTNASPEIASQVETAIREKIDFSGRDSEIRSLAEGFNGVAGEVSLSLFLPDRLPPRNEPAAGGRHSSWLP
jgi:hypothetical protein